MESPQGVAAQEEEQKTLNKRLYKSSYRQESAENRDGLEVRWPLKDSR